uniref:Uncharacterized protein n=1 Tax=Psilocybe cubensis TaxID=181762 RepID=A0A8H8CFE5_PSICU
MKLIQFVYPFTLEPHTVTIESSRRTTLAAHAARREAYLRSREEEKERRKREALRRIAPGFEPHGSLLVPTPKGGTSSSTNAHHGYGYDEAHANVSGGGKMQVPPPPPPPTRSVMDDLVDQLAALEGSSNTKSDSALSP